MSRGVVSLLLAGSALLAAGAAWDARGDDLSPVRQEIFRRLADGRRALDLGDAPGAVRDLCWASHRALNSRDAAWWCGRALLLAREPEAAVKALHLATDIDPRHLGSWVDLGNALLAAGRPDEARPAFYRAIAIRKDFSPAWDGLARLAQRTGDEPQALELFGKALDANAADARARLHRGQLHFESGRLDQAAADIAEAARLRPDDAEVQLGLARVELAAGQPDDALAAARRAGAITPKDPRVPAITAEIFLRMDALTEAESAARSALGLEPREVRARIALAEALGRQGKLADALEVLSPPAPDFSDPQDADDMERARALWRSRVDQGERLEQDAQRPDAPVETLFALAEIRLATGDRGAAASLAARAAAGTEASSLLRRAAWLLGQAERWSAAEEFLSRIDARGEAAVTDIVNLGVLRERLGDLDGAGAAYRRALALPGGAADAHGGLARIALSRADLAEAAGQLRAYLESGPPPEDAARARQALAQLEARP